MKRYRTLILTTLAGLAAVAAVFATRCSEEKATGLPPAATNSGRSRNPVSAPLERLSREVHAKMILDSWNVPIVFYGRMVDQDGNGLEGVTISYWVNEAPRTMYGNHTNINGTCISGANGLFTIRGKGEGVGVARMEKPGYRIPVNGRRAFWYGPSVSASSRHEPDESKPVELLLIRSGLPVAEEVLDRCLSFAWNTAPVVIPLGPKVGTLTLLPTRSLSSPKHHVRSGFDWNLEIRCAGFGTIPRPFNENIARGAPASGYQSVLRFGGKKDDNPWEGVPSTHFFIKTSSGLYGEIELVVDVGDVDNSGFNGRIKVWLNESGGRNVDHGL